MADPSQSIDIATPVRRGIPMDCDQAIRQDASHMRVFAGVAAGKTEFLVRKAASLVASGCDPSRILVVVNTDAAARAFRERLERKGMVTPSPSVQTALRVLVHVLSTDDARRATGRTPRLLTRAEFNVVLEDLKRGGIEVGTLAALLPPLFAALAAGTPLGQIGLDAPGQEACRALFAHLAPLNAMLREEVSPLALRYLDGMRRQRADTTYSHVLIDDAHNLGPATLQALSRLAACQCIATGNPDLAQPGFDVGFSQCALEGLFEAGDAVNIDLEPDAQTASPVAAKTVACVKWREPFDEFRGTARIVADLLKGDCDLLPHDIYVAVPNRIWAAAIKSELERRHVASQTVLDDNAVRGDPRSSKRLGSLGAYAGLALAADPTDPAAWRFWIALGNQDVACTAWANLCALSQASGQEVYETIEALTRKEAPSFEGSALIIGRARAAEELLRALAGKRGFVLRAALRDRCASAELNDALEFFDGDEDAAELFAALQSLSFTPSFADRPSQVCIGSYRAAQALSPRHIVAPGLVDGTMPSVSDTERGTDAGYAQDLERRAFCNAIGKARDSLVIGTFQRIDKAQVDRLRLHPHRTRYYQGRDVALFVRSAFLDELGDALPGSVSGEQFFGTGAGAPTQDPSPETSDPQLPASDPVIAHPQRCVRVRNRHTHCQKCVDACAAGGLSLQENGPVVDRKRCVGCGACSTACPTCALEAADPNDASLFNRARTAMRMADGEVVLATDAALAQEAGSYDPRAIVRIPTLGRVEETLLVKLVRAGARGIVLVSPHATDPIEAQNAASARMVCKNANRVLAAWGSAVQVHLADMLPPCAAAAPAASPAAAVQDSAGRLDDPGAANPHPGTQSTAGALSRRMKVMRDKTLPHFMTDRREELLDALFEMGEPVADTLQTRLWGHVRINSQLCTGCRLCATFCPTGALFKFDDGDGTTGIEHTPSDCVQCLCCQDICRAGALTVDDTVHTADILPGTPERFLMPPEELFRSSNSSIYHAVQKALGIDCLSER